MQPSAPSAAENYDHCWVALDIEWLASGPAEGLALSNQAVPKPSALSPLKLSVPGRLNDVQVDTVHTGPEQRLFFAG